MSKSKPLPFLLIVLGSHLTIIDPASIVNLLVSR